MLTKQLCDIIVKSVQILRKKQEIYMRLKSIFRQNRVKSAVMAFVAILSLIVILFSYIFPVQNGSAEEKLSVGTLVAQDTQAVCIKDTICVKRWHEYTFSIYYMGEYNDVFIKELHTPMIPTVAMEITFSATTQSELYYSVAETFSASVSEELSITSGISLEGFMSNASSKATSALAVSYAETLSKSETNIAAYSTKINVDGINTPLNCVYGDLLLINNAYKYKLVVYKQQHAKHRKSALHKWGEYQIESTETNEFYFYSLNNNIQSVFYHRVGLIGTIEEYSDIINNVGK